jgi:hypothetical protein
MTQNSNQDIFLREESQVQRRMCMHIKRITNAKKYEGDGWCIVYFKKRREELATTLLSGEGNWAAGDRVEK